MPLDPYQSAFPEMAYSVNGLDRQANLRSDADFISALARKESARLLQLSGDKTLVTDQKPLVRAGTVPPSSLFLGVAADGTPWFAASIKDETEGMLDLRSIAVSGQTAPELLGRLAQARSLLHWHEKHGFCANCGQPTSIADAGYRRHCACCNTDHFPRTDPVIIIAVQHSRRLLLGRQASWKTGMFSTLAGFMEPGETIEDAARREVHEESNIRLGEVRYVTNQPWPFPASLMIGLIGEAFNDDIKVDPKELQEARWFSRDDILAMRQERHPENLYIPPPLAIAHRLIMIAAERL